MWRILCICKKCISASTPDMSFKAIILASYIRVARLRECWDTLKNAQLYGHICHHCDQNFTLGNNMLLIFKVNSWSLIFDTDIAFLQARLGEIEKSWWLLWST